MKSILRLIGSIAILALFCVVSGSSADVAPNKSVTNAADRSTIKVLTANLPEATPVTTKRQRAGSALTGITMSWSVSPGGGFAGGTSTQYGLSAAAGQTAVGEGSNAEFATGIGFYHGVETCDCDNAGDFNLDGTYDSVDLNLMIAALFFNGNNPQDPTCPIPRADVNCDSTTDSIDLNLFIVFLFFNGQPPCNACTGQPI